MDMRAIPILILTLLLVGLPAGNATGQDNGGIDQYTEQVPGGAGEEPSSGSGDPVTGADQAGGGTSLPDDVIEEFESAGSDGTAAAELAQSVGSPERPGRERSSRRGDPGSGPSDPSSGGDGGVGRVISEVVDPGDSGLGIALPIILGGALLAALALGIARIRSLKHPA